MISHQDWRNGGFRYIVPILPLAGELSPASTLTEAARGKSPAFKGMHGWKGFDWRAIDPSDQKLATWHRQGAGIGIQGKDTAGLDIDVTNAELAAEIAALAQEHMGQSPTRIGNPPKRLLPYRWAAEPLLKRKLKFELAGVSHAVELLGDGQQWVADGIHPGTGKPYTWDVHPTVLGRDALPAIGASDLDAFFMALEAFLVARGAVTELSASAANAPPQEGLRAPSNAAVREIVALIPNDGATDYDAWCKVAYAIRASLPDDPETGADIWREFSERSEGTPPDPAITEKTWEGTQHGPWKVGYHTLCDLACKGTRTAGAVIAAFEYDEPRRAENPEPRGLVQDISDPFASESERPWGFRPWILTPYFEPGAIPERDWVLGSRFMGKAVTAGFGPPGVAKSMFAILSAIAIASGISLTSEDVHSPGPAWIHNNEEDLAELQRRVAGICNHFGIRFSDLDGRLHISSGYDHKRLIIARKKSDTIIAHPDVERVKTYIRDNGIRHMVVDPFVSTHSGVSENANEEVEQVLTHYRRIAVECNCSIDLVHHTVKTHSGDSERHAGDQNAGRGASSIMGAVRVAYTLAAMSEKSRDKLQLPQDVAARLIRLDRAKGNYSPKEFGARWFELVSVPVIQRARGGMPYLHNGDTVGVPIPYAMAKVVEAAETAFGEIPAGHEQANTVKLAALAMHQASPKHGPMTVYAVAKAMARLGNGSVSTYRRHLMEHLPIGEPSPRYLQSASIIDGEALQLWIEPTTQWGDKDMMHCRSIEIDLLT